MKSKTISIKDIKEFTNFTALEGYINNLLKEQKEEAEEENRIIKKLKLNIRMNEGARRQIVAQAQYKGRKSMEEDVLGLINKMKIKAIKDICKNMNVKAKTLCQFGTLGLMTVEGLVETFYGEEQKSKIELLNKKRK